jgi:hypothetical protein
MEQTMVVMVFDGSATNVILLHNMDTTTRVLCTVRYLYRSCTYFMLALTVALSQPTVIVD